MIKFRTHNFTIQEMKSWPTDDKIKTIQINDEENKLVYFIDFTKEPKFEIYELEEDLETLGERRANFLIRS